jgi:cyanophycin synthetase
MEILESRIMMGPNFWSADQKQLIVLKVKTDDLKKQDIAELVKRATAKYPGFFSRHFASAAARVNGLAGLTAILALELQIQASMPCHYFDIRPTANAPEHYVIYAYTIEQAGTFAGESAIAFINSLIKDEKYDIASDLQQLKRIRNRRKMGATSAYILSEVKKRNIPFRRFDNSSLLILGHGYKQRKIRTAVCDSTSGLGIELAGDKEETKELLKLCNVPVPEGILVYSEDELKRRIAEVQPPLVIKPLDGNHGRGVSTNIKNIDDAVLGFGIASKISDSVIVEEFVEGDDYRFLVINYQLVAVARRMPANVTGNGKDNIARLIEQLNKDPRRGNDEHHVLAPVAVDEITNKLLKSKNYTLETIPAEGEIVILKDTANISAGGTADDVTDLVHPENKFMVERIARIFGLDICGVDIVTKGVDVPITRKTGAVIEVNAGPGLRMHSDPQKGKERNVAAPVINMLFPRNMNPTIPIVAITGTNGKTTVTRLIAHLAACAGYRPGFTTTDGIYINGHRIFKGDCTGYRSSQDVLFDPYVDMAVLECARGGIIRSGLGFDQCDIGIVTNVTSDHLGLKDIHSLEQMARVKMTVPLSVKRNGFAILNADNDLTYNMRKGLKCNVALFSLYDNNERVLEHCWRGGLAVIIEHGFITICNGNSRTRVAEVRSIPLSFGGRAESMIKNLLPSLLAAHILQLNPEMIMKGLMTFIPSPSQTPGRMNIFKFPGFEVMIDYAHNTDSYLELKKFMEKTTAREKVGVIGVAGDRKDSDIMEVGSTSARIFDKIVIRHDIDMRGRPKDEMTALLKKGIERVNPDLPVTVISNEQEAISQVIEQATPGSFIVVLAEGVEESIRFVQDLQEQKNRGQMLSSGA